MGHLRKYLTEATVKRSGGTAGSRGHAVADLADEETPACGAGEWWRSHPAADLSRSSPTDGSPLTSPPAGKKLRGCPNDA